ncbi:MAG: hypothetical protein MUO76_13225 [Anaerolineaceae bacterium]|nr:hypothetical protein [Anaerolineaceae bacterium]
MSPSEIRKSKLETIYKIGAVTAISAVLVGIIETILQILPVANAPHETVLDWFILLWGFATWAF